MRELQEVSSIDIATVDVVSMAREEPGSGRKSFQVPAMQPMPEVGMELGGFRIEKRLGRGGMGEVWLANDEIGDRKVVIKLLQPELQQREHEMAAVKESFRRIHSLQHQHICPVYLLGQDARFGYFIVMKYIDGVTLSTYRKAYVAQRGSIPVSEVVRLLAPVAKALDYAHASHVLHRDVKPQNLMVSRDSQNVQLVDFGLSADIKSSMSRITGSSIDLAGTYPYMSPEQWRGEVLDARADQYALAVTAYELIAGRRPFEATDPTILKLCVTNDPPPKIDGLPDEVHATLIRGLAKAKQDRFPNCVAFVAALAGQSKPLAAKNGSSAEAVEPSTYIEVISRRPTDDAPTNRLPLKKAPSTREFASFDDESKSTDRPNNAIPIKRPARKDDVEDWDEDELDGEFDEFEPINALRDANRQATFWVGLIGGIGVVTVATIFVFVFLYPGFFNSNNDTPIVRSKDQVDPNGNGSNTVKPDNGNEIAQGGGEQGIKPTPVIPAPVVPPVKNGQQPPAEGVLRYQWQPGHAYVYSVNVDIEREDKSVVTLAGNLTYSALKPVERPGNRKENDKGTGTAFVVHPDGWLMTCAHVVDGNSKIEVALGGKTYEAVVVASDDIRDIALIRIDAKGLPSLGLGNSGTVEIGEDVRAIGFPLSSILGDNVKQTRGTISGINQDDGQAVLQVDAGINPGNSGGPLVDERGDVIGINFAKLLGDVATNVGFAVPIDDAKKMLTDHGVKFVTGQSKSKLEGPALVKKVSVATALVTVTAGAGAAAGSRVTLQCDGSLTPRVRAFDGGAGNPLAELGLHRQMIFSSLNQLGSEADQVDTDSIGRIHDLRGSKNLPSFLGRVSRLIVEELPAGRQRTWSQSHPVTITIQEQDESPFSSPFGGPRFGPRFRPPGFPGFPGGGGEPKTQQFHGSFKAVYTLAEKIGEFQIIKKSLEIKTRDALAAGPRIWLKGDGKFMLNTTIGLPHELYYTATLIENEANKATKIPLTLSYKFVETLTPEELAKRKTTVQGVGNGFQQPGQPATVKPAAEEPGDQVEADTKLEVGQKLLCEWARQWFPVKIVSVVGDGTVRIHWEGWTDSFDETLPRARLRLPKK